MLAKIASLFTSHTEEEKKLIDSITRIVGSRPINLSPYNLATQHSSVAKTNSQGVKLSNERLEFLGDAVLDAVVAELLFQKFPLQDEGFLTDIRSRIVNREALNRVANKIGVNTIVEFDVKKKTAVSHKSLYGDALEALVGAVYLDKGFLICKKFILHKLILPHFDLDELVNDNPNFKSKIIEWGQKQNIEIRFDIIDVKEDHNFKEFTAQVYVGNVPKEKGVGLSKKKAEQQAAERTWDELNID